MKRVALIGFLFWSGLALAQAGGLNPRPFSSPAGDPLDPPRFEIAVESGYLLCWLDNPHGYEVVPNFITGRVRWGVLDTDTWYRGYQQFYLSGVIEPIVRGPENFYYGMSFGLRYNLVPRNSRFSPYISGGVGLGWIDSHANVRGAQGQDFTFNILGAAGVSYKLNERWKLDVGALYQHLSNAGQTSPNPSLNLIGPQVSIAYSF